MPRLDNAEKHHAIGMLNAGAPVQRVVAALRVHNTTIYRLQQRVAATGTASDRPRPGQSRVTTPRQCDRFGGPSVMVRGAITRDFRSLLVVINGTLTAHRYINNVLQPTVLPFMTQHGGPNRFIFQQDNATPHSARKTQQFLQQNEVRVMAWPAMSLGMNCIEHLWDILGRRTNNHVPRVQTRGDLIAALQYHWNNIPQREIRRLVVSMPRRLRECLAANGGHTRY